MAEPIRKVTIKARQLAFWETLMDVEPIRYLNRGDCVEIVGSVTMYGGTFADKEYYKVRHQFYGVGYMLKAGLDDTNETE